MKAIVILNPYSGRWKAQRLWPEVEAALHAADIDYRLLVSQKPGNAVELAAEAVNKSFSPIIIAGGDGTICEVVNGLAQSSVKDNDQLGPIGVLPLGTANDFVKNLGLPRDLRSAAQVIANGRIRLIDIGQLNDKLFVNNSAIGLEAYICAIQKKIQWVHGTVSYFMAALRGIANCPQWLMHMEWEGDYYKGPVTLVTVGNGPRSGGLFYTVPHADPFDGKLTFVYGYKSTRLQMLRTLPMAMKPGDGSYVELDGINEFHTTWLKVRTEQPTPAHIDGELFTTAIQHLEYRILPARLHVLMG